MRGSFHNCGDEVPRDWFVVESNAPFWAKSEFGQLIFFADAISHGPDETGVRRVVALAHPSRAIMQLKNSHHVTIRFSPFLSGSWLLAEKSDA